MKKSNIVNLFEEEIITTPENTCFSVNTALIVGIEKALIIGHLRYWLVVEKTYEFNKYKGTSWFRAANKDWHTLFPYLKIQKILYLLRELEAQGYIVIQKFENHDPKYKFYTLTKNGWTT